MNLVPLTAAKEESSVGAEGKIPTVDPEKVVARLNLPRPVSKSSMIIVCGNNTAEETKIKRSNLLSMWLFLCSYKVRGL